MRSLRRSRKRYERSRTNHKQRGGDADTDLSVGIIRNNPEEVQRAINAGADVNKISIVNGMTPIFELCDRIQLNKIDKNLIQGYLNMMKLLLENGADPNIALRGSPSMTPLIFLIMYIESFDNSMVGAVKLLLEYGADPNIGSQYNMTLLRYAIVRGNLLCVKLLLEYGADSKNAVNWILSTRDITDEHRKKLLDLVRDTKPSINVNNPNTYDVKGYMSLHRLAFSEEPEEVLIEKAKELLARGANLEAKAKTKLEEAPVMLALQQKKSKLVSFFLDAGANPNAQNKIGSSLLQYAAMAGLLDLVIRLQSMGNNPVYTNKQEISALHYAANMGHLDVVKYLVSQGANINAVTNSGTTPLLWSLHVYSLQQQQCAEFLLENGADPNLSNPLYTAAVNIATHPFIPLLLRYGADPNILHKDSTQSISVLMVSITQKGSLETVKLLVEAGADVNYTNEHNATALMLAIRADLFNKDIVRYLLEKGADPNKGMLFILIGTETVRRPIVSNIFYGGHYDLLSLFLEKGQDPNITFSVSPDSTTSLLHTALQFEQMDALRQLLDAGGNPNLIANNMSVLQYAIFNKTINGVKILLKKGADPNLQNEDKNTALHIAVLMHNKLNPHEKKKDVVFPNIIEVLLEHGADKNIKNKDSKTPADLAEDEVVEMALGVAKFWEGWSRSDIAFLNGIFTDETRPVSNNNAISKATDYSLCPVCLKTVERPSGCMHMKHDCASQGGFYHKELYDKYKVDGGIHWCTICNRIGWASGSDFRHYNLGLAEGPIPGKAYNSYLYDKDCSVRSGGGGLPEKYHRFNRLRNVALRFNHPAFIGKKYQREILEKLTEDMWDAPFVHDPLSEIQWSEKQWNRPNTNFPLPPTATTANANTNIPVPNTVQDPIIHSTETNNFTNATLVDEKNILQFRHPDSTGIIRNHDKPGQQISRMAFASWLSDLLGEPATNERFGHCWQYSEIEYGQDRCTAKLYPKEVRLALGLTEEPTEGENAEYRQLYKNYRMLFNRKERRTL